MGKDTETESTQKSEPWKKLQPHLENVFTGAESAADNPMQFYGGQTYANMDPMQRAGMDAQLAYANSGMGNQIGAAQQAHMGALNAPDVANNPYINAQADTITGRLNRNFNEELMPGIQQGAIGAGQTGSSRQGVAEGIAARGTQEALGDSLSNLYGNAYGQGLQAQQGAMGMAGQMANLGMLPGQVQQQIGGIQRGEEQRGIDEAMARHDYEQNEQWDRLSRYNSLLGGGAGYGTSTTTSTQPSNMFGNLLGAGMTAAGVMTGNPGLAASGLGGMFGGGAPSMGGNYSYSQPTIFGPSLNAGMFGGVR
ncbi:MAG: hypothetical protein GY746_07465 [Gammaproteobacteria bacterium]|nr:hypothetical protein [Gammaproteobacteria bacterium]